MLFFAMGGGVVVSESGGFVQSRYGFMVGGYLFRRLYCGFVEFVCCHPAGIVVKVGVARFSCFWSFAVFRLGGTGFDTFSSVWK